MPTSTLKRPSTGGGRLRRLLASLRPPARKGPLPVQTGFPTSLADIVVNVKHHGRLSRNNPRRQRHRATSAAAPWPHSAAAAAAVAEPPPPVPEYLSVPHDAAPVTVTSSLRPSWPVAAAGGGAVVVLALLLLVVVVTWSKQLVAAATLASVALAWIESGRTVRRGPRRPETIREEAAAAESDDSGSGEEAAASLCSADSGDDSSSSASASANEDPNPKQSRRRSLRRLLAGKLRSGKGKHRLHLHEHPESPRRPNDEAKAAAAAAAAGDIAEETPLAAPPEAVSGHDRYRSHRRRRRALPLPALVPIILAGLVAGKIPALALAVLCVAFSGSVDRIPVPLQDSGDPSPR